MDPTNEYATRLAAGQRKVRYYDQWHQRLGNLRLLFAVVVLLVGAWLCRAQVTIGLVFVIITARPRKTRAGKNTSKSTRVRA